MADNALEFLHFAETMAAECAAHQHSKDESARPSSSHAQPQSHEIQRDDAYRADLSTSSYHSRTSNSIFASTVRPAENQSLYSTDRCRVEWQPDVFHDSAMSLRQRYRMDEDYESRHPTLYNAVSTLIGLNFGQKKHQTSHFVPLFSLKAAVVLS